MNRFLAFCLLLPLGVSAQNVFISGIINHYAAATAMDTCTAALTVSDTTGFRPGRRILVIQMQGATMDESLSVSYGAVKNLNCAGCFESVVVDSVADKTLFLRQYLIHPYDWNGKVQVVTIPRYTAVTVTDTLKPKPWDGTTGGILVLDAAGGTLTLNAPISADGAGFRGGTSYVAPANNCNALFPQIGLFYPEGSWRGGRKGEGVVNPVAGKELGRGAQTNGGGGGNDHNSGGGGGGHFVSGGGGGRNNEPNALGCDGDYPGLGGLGINAAPQRAFLGGGGGAGHSNNFLKSGGGAGGGIIYLRAGFLLGPQQIMTANGLPGSTSEGDGGGGGGAGGTLWISIPNPPVGIQLSARGGDGGNSNATNANRCYGPGGGGAGGRIVTNLWSGLSPTIVSGGKPGIILNSTNGCNGSSGGAETGNAGSIEGLAVLPPEKGRLYAPRITAHPQSDTVCDKGDVSFSVGVNPGPWTFQWEQDNGGGGGFQNLTNGPGISGAQEAVLRLNPVNAFFGAPRYRCLVRKNNCPPVISTVATLKFNLLPTADFSYTKQNGTVRFTAQTSRANGLLWQFGDGATGQGDNPVHEYTENDAYTVVLKVWNDCDTVVVTKIIPVTAKPLPVANFAVADTTVACTMARIFFQNRSSANATAFQWEFPGGTPAASVAASPEIQYNAAGTYTARLIASNAGGADTIEHTFVVRFLPKPVADFTTTTSGRTIQFTHAAQNAQTFTWLFGDGSAAANTPNAGHTYTQGGKYVVSLTAANGCGAAVRQKRVLVN